MEVTEQVELEEREIIMALSQVYVEWEKQTEARGEARGEVRGIEQEKRSAILLTGDALRTKVCC
jgi:hypothetical protein